jgi:excisionase family DNA binding protein
MMNNDINKGNQMSSIKRMLNRKELINQTWLTLKEASEYLRISPRSIRRAMSRGHLRRNKIGGRYLFHKKWLDRFACGYGQRMSKSQMKQLEQLLS